MIPFMGETVCRAFNLVFIPVFLLLYIYIYIPVLASTVPYIYTGIYIYDLKFAVP